MAEEPEPAKGQPTDWELALAVGNLPLAQVRLVLRAIESDQERWHEYRLRELHLIRVRELEISEQARTRTDRLAMIGLAAGFVVAVTMLIVAVIALLNDQPTVAGLMAGPSAVALVATFVLRRSGDRRTGDEPDARPQPNASPIQRQPPLEATER
ncbi:hypothetical protein Rhe02_37660 [Rhizocola hellebori]|uniref:DUF2335 domain-containing protein n=1 Tax=Rhizocola hellebori TaxID=1392758 RepID=A0A8J3Q7Y6_9ACTN|nr:hypothetical protein Rhe02_37660 [Rhizocola hellebori]